ncbi:MAG: hypothetical protein R3301_03905 [Saprospiraceae bacterium]|nr:hypothetical protein [Saprospiraceae bacterium]
MSRVVYREEQRYPTADSWFLTGLFGLLIVMALIGLISGRPMSTAEGLLVVTVALAAAGAGWYLNRLRMQVRVNEKNLKLKYLPIEFEKRKIKWKHVKDIELIRLPRFYKWRGWNVHYSSGNKWYNISGKAVIKLTLKDDQVVLIGIRRVDKLEDVLRRIERTKEMVHAA